MLSRNEIITALYTSKEIAETLSKVDPEQLREDLRQEVFTVLCELSEERLQEIYYSKQEQGLRYYTVRIIWNMLTTRNHKFTKDFRQRFFTDMDRGEFLKATVTGYDGIVGGGVMDSIPDIPEDQSKEEHELIEFTLSLIEGLPYANREILRYYVESGYSSSVVEKMTGISERTIRYNLQRSREIVQKQLNRFKK